MGINNLHLFLFYGFTLLNYGNLYDIIYKIIMKKRDDIEFSRRFNEAISYEG